MGRAGDVKVDQALTARSRHAMTEETLKCRHYPCYLPPLVGKVFAKAYADNIATDISLFLAHFHPFRAISLTFTVWILLKQNNQPKQK